MSSPEAVGHKLPRSASDLMGVAEDFGYRADSADLLRELLVTGAMSLRNPAGIFAANVRLLWGSAGALAAAAELAVGRGPGKGPIAAPRGDRRFADPAFQENPAYFLLAQQYLLFGQLVTELLDSAGVTGKRAAKARFAANFLLSALAPTNTLLGNPAAVRAAFDTGGKSVVRGLANLLHDLRHNGGWPSQVDRTGFEVGVNMAATPGSVVYRSDLIELIQYSPQTPDVYAVPLLFCPPWINKYYIMDLAPGKSLIEWAVQHGHTCFAISYRNPDKSMSDLGFRDYLFGGPLDALRVVREITGTPSVNTVSVCLGGTLTALGLAHNAAVGDDSVNSATFLNTHTDFTEPGLLGVFTDEATVNKLEKHMRKTGYLDSSNMARTFSALRPDDLVFQYVANNWLLGKKPPSFDLLAWNADSTRMPARMHSEYLRSCYLHNEFARGQFEVDGTRLDPGRVDVDAYVLSAVDDHIVPWTSAYKTTQLLGGKNRFVLSTSGHIAGIVNPPNPKAKHWVNDSLPADPQEWKANAQLVDGTWWQDWTAWIGERGGERAAAPEQLGSRDHPPIQPAPGSYVRPTA
ncbi:PHA/PHB synthase family protein [Candidatus Mycobacterium methanotrophicum]|uniref:Alpha/beta fold hydrolase n=1 Tax=Candidatus Mycobacterium methanotrophicum TaxID=2943498 RepID=A0ABY4QKZ0_9MYCO|nr:alpha/beta fold hydrolase [Candidatus Mycobacterium methanotrophicum]UQX11653.1 alpha/beta fold hydrolase [Candidatus Mycobacterium methanotrophicum]